MTGDPCALLTGSLKQACQNTNKLIGGPGSGSYSSGSGSNSSGSGSSSGTSIWGFLTDPLSIVGGFRHLMLRFAEGTVGVVLVIVGINALVKPAPVIKKVAKAVK